MFAVLDALNNGESFVKKSISLMERIFSKDLNEEYLACEVIMNSQATSQTMGKKVNSVETNEICKNSFYVEYCLFIVLYFFS
jgi:hypothetical protein